jgi:hypothetical protein
MNTYLNRVPVEVTPRFRAGRKGPTVASASLSVPLRFDDLVSILYHAPLSAAGLADADAVREAVMDALVNHGGTAIARDKDALETAYACARLTPDQRARLARCQQRIVTVFGRPAKGLRDPGERSPLYRNAA